MWVFTRYGMYSVVCAWKGSRRVPDPDLVMVRARTSTHLENLINRFPEQLRQADILEDAGTDYRYRLILPKDVWVEIAAQLAKEIDYSNFKDSVADFPGNAAYERRLHEVWAVMLKLQAGEGTEET